MREVEAALGRGRHVAGWVAYEAAPAFDRALTARSSSGLPLVCFGVFVERHAADPLPVAAQATAPHLIWRPALSAERHEAGVAAIREAIASGETYQINYTFPLEASVPAADLEAWYAGLARQSRAPYAAFVAVDDWRLLSLSPELFFLRDGRRLVTQPMKGTAPRGRWTGEDAAHGDALRVSSKNRAENVMIVDLCRNDLSRVCEVGSVQATSMFDVVRYPTVWQMVSTVEGTLREGAGLTDIFSALFPAGSITGAPKSSSMRLIAALEQAPRGVYCGAMGYASPDGTAAFNVAIRTMTVHTPSGRATYGVGGGITWDSQAQDEYAEALQKAACLDPVPPFALIETLRGEGGRLIRLDGHLRRLRASAEYFGFVFDEDEIRRAALQGCLEGRGCRIRLQLSPDGSLSVTAAPLDATPSFPRVALASSPVDSRDRWLFHKTTRREVYDRHRAEHPDAWDVLLWNERGELTEFTRGNVVLEVGGRLITPARESGLLGGALRQALIDDGTLVERIVTHADLRVAARVWFLNSLREWVEVVIPDTTAGQTQNTRP